MKILWVLLFTFITSLAAAEQPRSAEAIEAFQTNEIAQREFKVWKDRGYTQFDTSATLALARWNDEGVDGIYLVSTFFEKEDPHPFLRDVATVNGVVEISAGFVASIRVLDPFKTADALMGIKNVKQRF